jgi:hypothetical protein
MTWESRQGLLAVSLPTLLKPRTAIILHLSQRKEILMLRVKLGWAVTTPDHPDPHCLVLYRWLDLPLAPFAGLRLRNLFPDQNEPLAVIPYDPEGGVTWDLGQNCFVAEISSQDFPDTALEELLHRIGPEWRLATCWPDEK